MSQSYVPFLDSASATRKFHTNQRSNGSDTVEQYVQLTGEPYLAAYRAVPSAALALSAANSHILQVMAGSSLRVGIRRIRVEQFDNATSTGLDQWVIHRLTTAGTGGTSITPAPLDPADSACGATVMTLPSAKGTEGTLVDYQLQLIHATATTTGLNPVAIFDFTQDSRTKCLWIAAGTSNGICLKNLTSDAAATVRFRIDLVESAEGA
jgi:hypothetical protein